MPLATGTLTFAIGSLLGLPISPSHPSRVKVWIETNLTDDTIIDPDGNSIRLGKTEAAVNADGSGSFANLPLSSVRDGLQYRVWVEYPDARGRQQWSSGYFTFSASGDLADQTMEPSPAPVPWEYPVVQAAETARDKAEAAQAAAEAAAATATAPTDAMVAGKINDTSSETRTALNGAIAGNPTVTAKADASDVYTKAAADAAISDAVAGGLSNVYRPAITRQRSIVKKMISTFQSGHGWTVLGTAGAWNLNDTSDGVFGGQCISVNTNNAGSCAFQSPTLSTFDLTNQDLVLWLKVTGLDNLKSLKMFATGDGFTTFFNFMIYDGTGLGAPSRIIRDGEWIGYRFNFSAATLSGTPARNTLNRFRFIVEDKGVAGQTATIKFGGFGYYPRPALFPNGVVTLFLDDGFLSHRTVAAPILAARGFAATMPIICDAIDNWGMSLAQLREMQDVYGHEIAPHAYTTANHNLGLTEMSPTAALTEIQDLKAWMQDAGFGACDHYAYPLGYHNATTDGIVRRFFSTARTVYSPPMEVQNPGLPLRTRALLMSSGGLSAAQSFIDSAYTNGGWAQIVFHDIVTDTATGNQFTSANFTTLMDYLANKGIPVLPVGDVWRALAA